MNTLLSTTRRFIYESFLPLVRMCSIAIDDLPLPWQDLAGLPPDRLEH